MKNVVLKILVSIVGLLLAPYYILCGIALGIGKTISAIIDVWKNENKE